jgi:hypothetical protein
MLIPGTKQGSLEIREDPLKGMHVFNSRELTIKSYERALEMVQFGLSNQVNTTRSHNILFLLVKMNDKIGI